MLKWLLKPEHAGRYVVMNGHAVSALAKGGSDLPQQAYKDRSGADAGAYLLSAQALPRLRLGPAQLRQLQRRRPRAPAAVERT